MSDPNGRRPDGATGEPSGDLATRVVVAYPDGLSDWGRDQLTAQRFVRYLRRVMGEVHEGEEFEEFLDVGCCGNTLDVPLRVEAVEGGSRVGDGTEVEFVTRPGEVDGGWAVQSAGTLERAESDQGR